MDYQIQLEHFNGSLGILLELIRDNKYDIFDIPISNILEKYLLYLEKLKKIAITPAVEFIEMAAILVRIKTKMLLPNRNYNEIEDEDPRNNLVFALLEYQKIATAVNIFDILKNDAKNRIFKKKNRKSENFLESKSIKEMELNDLINALTNILNRSQQEIKKIGHKIILESRTVDEQIKFIFKKFHRKKEILFSELFQSQSDRNVIVITFIAILELIKQKKIVFQQNYNYGEIILIKNVK